MSGFNPFNNTLNKLLYTSDLSKTQIMIMLVLQNKVIAWKNSERFMTLYQIHKELPKTNYSNLKHDIATLKEKGFVEYFKEEKPNNVIVYKVYTIQSLYCKDYTCIKCNLYCKNRTCINPILYTRQKAKASGDGNENNHSQGEENHEIYSSNILEKEIILKKAKSEKISLEGKKELDLVQDHMKPISDVPKVEPVKKSDKDKFFNKVKYLIKNSETYSDIKNYMIDNWVNEHGEEKVLNTLKVLLQHERLKYPRPRVAKDQIERALVDNWIEQPRNVTVLADFNSYLINQPEYQEKKRLVENLIRAKDSLESAKDYIKCVKGKILNADPEIKDRVKSKMLENLKTKILFNGTIDPNFRNFEVKETPLFENNLMLLEKNENRLKLNDIDSREAEKICSELNIIYRSTCLITSYIDEENKKLELK